MKHRIAFLAALLAFVSLLLPKTALAEPGQEERLPDPPPPSSANVPNFGTTVRPDGTPLAVVVASGVGGTLNIIDLNTGVSTPRPLSNELIDVQAWGFATLPDRSVLIGSAHHLFRYDPSSDEVTHLSVADQPGWTDVNTKFESIWDIAVDESGTAYIATNARTGGRARPHLERRQGLGPAPRRGPGLRGPVRAVHRPRRRPRLRRDRHHRTAGAPHQRRHG